MFMGDLTLKDKKQEDPVILEIKNNTYIVSSGKEICKKLEFSSPNGAQEYKNRIEKITPWLIKEGYIKIVQEDRYLIILPGPVLKVNSSQFLDEPVFEQGASLYSDIRNQLKEYWKKLSNRYADIGFYLTFTGEYIQMVYFYLPDGGKEEFENELRKYGLGLEQLIKGQEFYKLKVTDEAKYFSYGGGIMELKVQVPKEQPVIKPIEIKMPDISEMRQKVDELLNSYPEDKTLLGLKAFLKKIEMVEKIETDYLPRIIGILMAYNQKHPENKFNLNISKDNDFNEIIQNRAMKYGYIVDAGNINYLSTYSVANRLVGQYEGIQQTVKDFKEHVFDNAISTIIEYYQLKTKYDQLTKDLEAKKKEIKDLENYKKKLAETNPKAKRQIDIRLGIETKEKEKIEKEQQKTKEKINTLNVNKAKKQIGAQPISIELTSEKLINQLISMKSINNQIEQIVSPKYFSQVITEVISNEGDVTEIRELLNNAGISIKLNDSIVFKYQYKGKDVKKDLEFELQYVKNKDNKDMFWLTIKKI